LDQAQAQAGSKALLTLMIPARQQMQQEAMMLPMSSWLPKTVPGEEMTLLAVPDSGIPPCKRTRLVNKD
jgi:hypothetical protein